jgi:hypothetical protein
MKIITRPNKSSSDYYVVSPNASLYEICGYPCKGYYYFIDGHLDVKRAREKFADSRCLGFLGVPFPAAYRLRRAGLPVYARYSEFEELNRLFDQFLLDPLASWGVQKYESLIELADPHHELIVVCPSIHGHMMDEAIAQIVLQYPVVKGLITDMPDVVRKVLDANSGA